MYVQGQCAYTPLVPEWVRQFFGPPSPYTDAPDPGCAVSASRCQLAAIGTERQRQHITRVPLEGLGGPGRDRPVPGVPQVDISPQDAHSEPFSIRAERNRAGLLASLRQDVALLPIIQVKDLEMAIVTPPHRPPAFWAEPGILGHWHPFRIRGGRPSIRINRLDAAILCSADAQVPGCITPKGHVLPGEFDWLGYWWLAVSQPDLRRQHCAQSFFRLWDDVTESQRVSHWFDQWT
jgi:hypothetical protein